MECLVKCARILKKEKGILADPETKRGRTLSQTVVEWVVEFYQSEEYSRMCPNINQSQRTLTLSTLKQKNICMIRLASLNSVKLGPNDAFQ